MPHGSYKPVEEDFDRMAESGITWISADFAWMDIERERSVYNFSYFDFVVENAEKKVYG
ncbi:beta-galactosidase [Candidatus Methanoliparum sp. LAM-1]|nr:beta-galactosidase [Candidatus Methanoliparum sp. LAM-1]